jgi:hypothetical protein
MRSSDTPGGLDLSLSITREPSVPLRMAPIADERRTFAPCSALFRAIRRHPSRDTSSSAGSGLLTP